MAIEKIAMGINLRKNKNERSSGYGNYYPEVDRQKTLSLRGFAEHIESHGSLIQRDVIEAVLNKIVVCLPELVAQGVPVQLGSLGTFYPTAKVVKGAGVANIGEMEGLNPDTIVQGIRLRFKPDASKLDNLCGPAFKNACSLELRNIVDTEAVTINGKTRKVQTLLPISTAVAQLKNEGASTPGTDTNGGSSTGSDTGNGGNSGSQSGGSQSGGSSQGGSSTSGTPVLTISKTGSGSASVTAGGNMVNSGASIAEDTQVTITITPATGMTPSATINGNNVSLTEDSGTYSGSFARPGTNATLMINTGSSGDGDTN